MAAMNLGTPAVQDVWNPLNTGSEHEDKGIASVQAGPSRKTSAKKKQKKEKVQKAGNSVPATGTAGEPKDAQDSAEKQGASTAESGAPSKKAAKPRRLTKPANINFISQGGTIGIPSAGSGRDASFGGRKALPEHVLPFKLPTIATEQDAEVVENVSGRSRIVDVKER
jgi:hypothetical protein